MAPPRAHIMRTLRLQLKSGFRRVEPPEYTFMKRYPPLHRDTKPSYHKIEEQNIPYLDLFKKAADRNPIYNEQVYPAYWQQEPQALVIAKKQYQHMMNGDDEETAFQKAEMYINEIENKAYVELRSLRETLQDMNAKPPFIYDVETMEDIEKWQAKVGTTPYDELELADQGEIDYLIQTKIMGWNEVERERRMRDPIFVLQFDQLRELLFPEAVESATRKKEIKSREYRENYFKLHDINYHMLSTSSPFYLEDYASWFAKLKEQPDIRQWSAQECEALSAWIVDTLAMREAVEKYPNHKVQSYLDSLKIQFFPVLRFPERADEFSTPTVAEMKKLLYEHKIGYKQVEAVSTASVLAVEGEGNAGEDNKMKVFVKRFYRLPGLLFPKETFMAAMMADRTKLRELTENEDSDAALLNEMMNAGVDEASLDELKAQLQEYVAKAGIGMPDYAGLTGHSGVGGDNAADLGLGSAGSFDMSTLDSILKDAFDDDNDNDEITNASKKALSGKEAEDEAAISSSDSDSDDTSSSSDSDDEDVEEEGVDALHVKSESDWQKLVNKYKQPATTELEIERDRVYGLFEFNLAEEAQDETDLEVFQQMRRENEIIARARMERVFSQKEAARVHREWVQRGVWLDNMPMPSVPLVGED
mmetsp:Transcript_493/g.660  ORF Transcript_493/g.660 Transcript_493/m.660 type:complete len:646 (+) Transcript_493:105-2042(+)